MNASQKPLVHTEFEEPSAQTVMMPVSAVGAPPVGAELAACLERVTLCAEHAAHYAGLAQGYAEQARQLVAQQRAHQSTPPPAWQAPAAVMPAHTASPVSAWQPADAPTGGPSNPAPGLQPAVALPRTQVTPVPGTYSAVVPSQPMQHGHSPMPQAVEGSVVPSQPVQPQAGYSAPVPQAGHGSVAPVPSPTAADASQPGYHAMAETPSGSKFQAPPSPEDKPRPRVLFAAAAAGVGVVIGALLWGGIGFVTGGWEFKYGAVLIGFIVGGLVLKGAGAPSKAMGVVAGVASLISLVLGKGLFELLVHPSFTMSQHIAYHTTVIDLIFFVATVATGFVVASSSGAIRKLRTYVIQRLPRTS